MINFVTALRYFLYKLEQGIEDEIGDGTDPYCKRLEQSVLPVIHGTKIVMALSMIERLVIQVEELPQNTSISDHQLKQKLINLGFDQNWNSWVEFEGFLSLRHCFAHEFGRLTNRQTQPLNGFLKKLKNSEIHDEKGAIVQPFFEIVNDQIELKPSAVMRLAKLCNTILNHLTQKGLKVEKSPYESS